MKNIVLLIILFVTVIFETNAQQAKSVDTFMTEKAIKQLEKVFTLTRQQEAALYKAGILANKARRSVFTNYWKTDSFRIMLARADYYKDSLYRSVLGETKMKIYRDTLLKQKHSW
jgi:hypothetical protein